MSQMRLQLNLQLVYLTAGCGPTVVSDTNDAPSFGYHAHNIVVDFYPPSPPIKTALNVRFGSKADMCSAQAHVR
jgi:hypothetical protein